MLDEAGWAYPVIGLGPGKRVALWVRGCQRRCPGCIAPELWEGGDARPVTEIAKEMRRALAECAMLTISGGEPFEQPAALLELIKLLRTQQEVEVLLYSGYLHEEIAVGSEAVQALLAEIDILIDGVYIEEETNDLQWRGSDNQRVYFLFASAQQRYTGQADDAMPATRPLQLQQLASGQFRVIGIPRRGDMLAQRLGLIERGLRMKDDDE